MGREDFNFAILKLAEKHQHSPGANLNNSSNPAFFLAICLILSEILPACRKN